MRRSLLLLVAAALSSSPAIAQDLNVDLDVFPSESGPVPAYPGAAGQTGAWCIGYELGASHTLCSVHHEDPDGAFVLVAGGEGLVFDHPAISGDDAKLLEDGVAIANGDPAATFRFGPLHAGEYAIFTYAWDPRSTSNVTRVTVAGAVEGAQDVGGAWNGAHALGTTYALHHRTVATGGMIELACSGVGTDGFVSGFQLVWTGVGAGACFGDGVAGACPCSNHSDPHLGRGCVQSSLNSLHLYAAGTTSPDTMRIYTHDEYEHNNLNTSVIVIAQGSSIGAPQAFGDGLLCVGGPLLRLYTRISADSSAPIPGEPSISARSAALGDPLAPGSTRWYFAFYRDSSATWCPAPAGNVFNSSNAWSIPW
jgi:hypothetical protein